MTDETVSIKNLIPGKRYRVVFSDCCVRGEYVGEFISAIGNDSELPDLIFDGFQLYDWMGHAVDIYLIGDKR